MTFRTNLRSRFRFCGFAAKNVFWRADTVSYCYRCEVRWLSNGKFRSRFWALQNSVYLFLSEINELLTEREHLLNDNLAFLVDLSFKLFQCETSRKRQTVQKFVTYLHKKWNDCENGRISIKPCQQRNRRTEKLKITIGMEYWGVSLFSLLDCSL